MADRRPLRRQERHSTVTPMERAVPSTISIAASMTTATSKRTMLEGGLVRNVYAGLANRNGLLAAALYDPVFTEGVTGPHSLVIVAVAFVALTAWKAPAWAVVLGAAGLGALLL